MLVVIVLMIFNRGIDTLFLNIFRVKSEKGNLVLCASRDNKL